MAETRKRSRIDETEGDADLSAEPKRQHIDVEQASTYSDAADVPALEHTDKATLKDQPESDVQETGLPRLGEESLDAADSSLVKDENREDTSQVIHMRALVVTQDAAIIIGKGGKNVNEIRDKSGSRVTITEHVQGNPERVMSVSGPLDAVSKAFGLVVRRINDEPFDQASNATSRAVTIRFIIPNQHMGPVIGKNGMKIKEIQDVSGAKLQASGQFLPNSNDRVLSVSGVADAIHIAVFYVGTVLQEAAANNPSTTGNHSQYRPHSQVPNSYTRRTDRMDGHRENFRQARPDQYRNDQYRNEQYRNDQYRNDQYRNDGRNNFDRNPYYGGRGPQYAADDNKPRNSYPGNAPNSSTTADMPGAQSQQIYIPNELVASIIGRQGAKINEIRTSSGCNIKINQPNEAAPDSKSDERLVTITGLPPNIQTAVRLLYSRLEEERDKRKGATYGR